VPERFARVATRRFAVVGWTAPCLLIASRKDNAMPSPAEVVRELCSGIDRKDLAAVAALLDEKVVYHNIGNEPAVGREATLHALKFQFDMFEPIAFKIRNLAVAGDTVLTERVDEITANGITAPVPVMGTFEVRDGRIVAWRDYFDVGLTGKLIAGQNVDSLLPG
jgi:limonene-1,2-epoxide hydrolase